jgi:hypothetical protein
MYIVEQRQTTSLLEITPVSHYAKAQSDGDHGVNGVNGVTTSQCSDGA